MQWFVFGLLLEFIRWVFGLAINLLYMLVRVFKYLFMKHNIRQNMLQLQSENISKRMVYVEAALLHAQNGMTQLQASGNTAMLLAGETQSIDTLPALPASNTAGRFRNTIISGGNITNRSLALLRTCESAYASNLPVIVVHAGNTELESRILGSPVFGKKYIISPRSRNCTYDPLLGLSNVEAARSLILSAENQNIRSNQNYLLLAELLADLYVINSGGRHSISLLALLRQEPANILRMIQNAQANRLLDPAAVRNMTQRYNTAQQDIPAFSYFLRDIQAKLGGFYSSGTSPIPPAVRIEQVINRHGGIIVIDMLSFSNGELFRMILEHLRILHRKNPNFAACFSDINICGYDNALLSYAAAPDKHFVISSRDIAADAGTNNQQSAQSLDRISGYAEDFVYFQHTSNSRIISQKLGTYERWDISYKWDASHARIIPDFSAGASAAKIINADRIQPQILQTLQGSQSVYYASDTNQIYIMNIR